MFNIIIVNMHLPREQLNHWATIDKNHATNNICEGENNRLSNRLQHEITLNTDLPIFPRIKISNPSVYRVFSTIQKEIRTAVTR